jgi:hypothetical protein
VSPEKAGAILGGILSRLTAVRLAQVALLAGLCLALQPSAIASSGSDQPSLYLSPSGSDSNACTEAAPCATMDRAYHVASPGQTVLLAAGSYPTQSIRPDATKTDPTPVVFTPMPGAQAQVVRLDVTASHVEFSNLQADWAVATPANGVTFRNVMADGAIYITGASNVSVLGGEIFSPVPVSSDSQIASIRGQVPTNILFDGVAFHDFVDVGPGQFHHIECLQVGAAVNLTVRDSKFWNCGTHDIFIRSWGMVNNSPSPLSNVLIENDWFARTVAGFYAMQVLDDLWTGSPPTSVTIRNNSALQTIIVRVSHGSAVVHGNLLPSMSKFFCNSYGQNQWYDYNVYSSGVPCGPHDVVGDPKYVDAANFDLDLQAGSAALGSGDPASHPEFDIVGKLRPMMLSPDAGASQQESADIVLGKEIGGATIGESRADVEQFYGAPIRKTSYGTPSGKVILATYSRHGGKLWILYNRANVVVGLGTSSRYYSTLGRLGVSVPTQRVVGALGARWFSCQKAYRRMLGSVAVYVVGQGQHGAPPVGSLWMVQRSFDECGHRPL